MSSESIEILGIGNAIVDCIALIDDDAFAAMGLVPGSMTLIEPDEAARLQSEYRRVERVSGGSVANTMFCCAELGARCQFIGKVADDALGDKFAEDLGDASVAYRTPRLQSGVPTAQSYIFVTPDAQRTFCTYLGATTRLTRDDLDAPSLREASAVLIEGYLWDSPHSVELIGDVAGDARASGTRIAVTLSDALLVDRHRPALQHFVETHADIVIANEDEAANLYQSATLAESVEALRDRVDLCVITCGAQGSIAVVNGEEYSCSAVKVKTAVDTTGAGDAYAGGFLYAMTRGKPIPECMRIGSVTAARTVQVIGARADQRGAI